MAVETKILSNVNDNDISYTAPEGGFVGRLHGEIVVDTAVVGIGSTVYNCASNGPTYIRILPPENLEDPYVLLEDVDYIKKVFTATKEILFYPGVPVQIKEDWTLEIVGDCPASFILMGYIED